MKNRAIESAAALSKSGIGTRLSCSPRRFLAASLVLGVALFAQPCSGVGLASSVIAGGGGASSGGTFVLQATAGQAAAGTSLLAGQFSMQTGFWPTTIRSGTLRITSVTHLANGHIALDGVGLANATYTVQVSPDLSTGSFVSIGTTMVGVSGTWHYDDASSAGLTKRFYRATFP
jgi:hypothetical protein